MPPIPYSEQRSSLVTHCQKQAGVHDVRVLKAMRIIPRHEFVPRQFRMHAYEDRPLSIGNKQTISQPSLVGLMTQLLKLSGNERVLEIGTGSGYQLAILAFLSKHVVSVERIPYLAKRAQRVLKKLGITNSTIIIGDGSKGHVEQSPYDRIIVTAAAQKVPKALVAQLKNGGHMVIPVHANGKQLLKLGRKRNGRMSFKTIESVSFVPLVTGE